MSDTLDVSVKLETPSGWIELEDHASGYTLSADSFVTSATTHRKTEVSSEWMEGTYVARSVKDNISEQVAVYIQGTSPYDLAQKIAVLAKGFDQLNYQMIVRFADSEDTWNCFVADYTITTKVEIRFATMALLQATVPRLPSSVTRKVYV
jgi:hypothetical protein